MAWILGKRSNDNLKGVDENLQSVIKSSISNSPLDFVVTCGVRTIEEQRVLVKLGKSTTMKSNHLTGKAVDIAVLVDGKVNWELKNYKLVAAHIKNVAKRMGIPIVWGGDWTTFIDGPHFELGKL